MAEDIKNTTGVLRQARIKTGVEGQDTRLAGNRQAHLSKGSFINYYDDLGFSTTAEGAKQFKDYQSNVSKQISTAQQGIADYEGQYNQAAGVLNKAKEQYGSYDKLVASSWDKTKSGFTTVKVVDPSNKVEAEYKIPKEAVEKLAAEKQLYTNYLPKENVFYVATRSKGKGPVGGKVIGQELHEAFIKAEKDIYNKWYEQYQPKLMDTWKTAAGQISAAESQLGTAKGQIAAAKTDVKLAQNKVAFDWQQLKDSYQKKKTEMGKVLAAMNFEEA